MTSKFNLADENEIYELTGCLSTCEKFEYAVHPMTDLTIANSSSFADHGEAEPNTLKLTFYITSGRHELREQVKYLLILQTKS